MTASDNGSGKREPAIKAARITRRSAIVAAIIGAAALIFISFRSTPHRTGRNHVHRHAHDDGRSRPHARHDNERTFSRLYATEGSSIYPSDSHLGSEGSKMTTLVHHCDLSWNQVESSLLLMHEKLVRFGFTYYDGKVVVVEPEEEGRNV